MEPFNIHILGCGSALPTLHHNASSQLVELRGKMFMIDCAEGTQAQLRRCHIGFNHVSTVFISHLHGDHCFGLIGMISTFGLQGRTAPLHIYAPKELRGLMTPQLDFFCNSLDFEVHFHDVDTTANVVVYEDKSLTVTSLPLRHRVPCCGYLFKEKPLLPHIRRDMIDFYNIPLSQVNNIKNGAGWTTGDGLFVPSSRLTTPASPPRSYAYCSDTIYMPTLSELVKGVDLLYHEATYASDKMENARKYFHSTAAQAATVARDAGVGRLLLGHYSARYDDESVLLDEARQIFPNTDLSDEGRIFAVGEQ